MRFLFSTSLQIASKLLKNNIINISYLIKLKGRINIEIKPNMSTHLSLGAVLLFIVHYLFEYVE